MRKIREVLRLHFECECRHREIAAACCMSPSTVGDYLSRAEQAGVTWEQAKVLSDAEVEARLFKVIGRSEPSPRAAIDFKWVHADILYLCELLLFFLPVQVRFIEDQDGSDVVGL